MPSPPSALPRLARGLAIVTGGSRGIGKAIASRFAAEGATVVLAGGRDAQSLESARSSLPVPEVGLGNETAEHVALPGDVGSVAFWEKLEAVVRDVAKPRSRMPASEVSFCSTQEVD